MIILFLLSVIFPFFHIAIIRKNYTEIILFVLIIMYNIIYLTANLYVLQTFNKPLDKYFSFTIINTVEIFSFHLLFFIYNFFVISLFNFIITYILFFIYFYKYFVMIIVKFRFNFKFFSS